MDRKITVWCIGILLMLCVIPKPCKAVILEPIDTVFYYLKIDTAGVDVGYLRTDSATRKNLLADDVKGDYAMWKIIHVRGTNYTLVNKMADTLKFVPPVLSDTIATIGDGVLKRWDDLFDEAYNNDEFITSYVPEGGSTLEAVYYKLTMTRDGVVMLSDSLSPANTRLRFSIERVKVGPDTDKYYRFKADTAGITDVKYIGFFSADTMKRHDSLTISSVRNDLSLWKFAVDTVISDTTFFKIHNKATDSILAFDIPLRDTVAYVKKTGELNQWRIPFFMEEKGIGRFMVRDTSAHRDYYLSLRNDTVMLASDTTIYKCLKFLLEAEGDAPDSCIVGYDSVYVHKVKYLNGDDAGKYLGVDIHGRKALLDTVYAHLPDGQFVVYKDNKYTFMSRAGSVTTGRPINDYFRNLDSLKVVYDPVSGDIIPRQFTNTIDTFEITPITYGNMEIEKTNPYLGYKYLKPDELSSSSYVFSYTSVDTLNGRNIGYDTNDSLVMLLSQGDTMRFILDVDVLFSTGAPAIAGIPKLQRFAYRLHSREDTTLYFSVQADSLAMDTVQNFSSFFLKEDTVPGKGYYFIEKNNSVNVRKLLADSTRHFNLAKIDSTDTHLFVLIRKERYIMEDDPYDYQTILPYGRGVYEFATAAKDRYLTKNYYHYAVLGKEGESMLRSGSYTPADFHLWIDTARGPGFNPDKPSFYIVKDVDSLSSKRTQPLDVSGYFLHVMDSTSLPGHDEYVVEIDGNKYNRVNFVKAYRYSANELLLNTASNAQAKDSVGFAGKNENAINEYRFYLQYVDEDADRCYIVTEQGYGGNPGIRGYLSVRTADGRLYVGPRDGTSIVPLTVSRASIVSNEVLPPLIEEATKKITVIGGYGRVDIRNAMGKRVVVYNVVGQQLLDRVMSSDNETLPLSRGILIIKVGDKITRKVVVR